MVPSYIDSEGDRALPSSTSGLIPTPPQQPISHSAQIVILPYASSIFFTHSLDIRFSDRLPERMNLGN